MESTQETTRRRLLRRGFFLEYLTLGRNLVGIVVLGITAVAAASVALAGFGLGLADRDRRFRGGGVGTVRHRAGPPAAGVTADRGRVRAARTVPGGAVHGRAGRRVATAAQPAGIGWTAVTAVVVFALAAGKARTGAALGNPVLRTEGRVALIDGLLATAVLAGLLLNTVLGWWWADPLAGYVLVGYAAREVNTIVRGRQ